MKIQKSIWAMVERSYICDQSPFMKKINKLGERENGEETIFNERVFKTLNLKNTLNIKPTMQIHIYNFVFAPHAHTFYN